MKVHVTSPHLPLCGLRLTGIILMQLLCDIHTAHMGPRDEREEGEEKRRGSQKTKKQEEKTGEVLRANLRLSRCPKCVPVNDELSSNMKCAMGVPQGSTLGPHII